MAHELDFSKGYAAIAYAAGTEVPWHGYGELILPTDTPEEIAKKAGLDYNVGKADAFYNIPNPNFDGSKPISEDNPAILSRSYENRAVVYRTDNGAPFSVMSNSHYVPAQPIEILNGLFELTKNSGFQMDVAGALKGGSVVWALARRVDEVGTIGNDVILPYVLILTSYDGSYARTARLTSIRVVCQNTLDFSRYTDGKRTAKQRNSREFDLETSASLLEQLGQYDKAFESYMDSMKAMAKVKMTDAKLKQFFAKLYAPEAIVDADNWTRSAIDFDRDGVSTNQKNNVTKLVEFFMDSPGAGLPSADGTLFGALNAVTYYQDHEARSKGEGAGLSKRWESATIGNGNRTKAEAFETAMELLAA